MDEDNQSQRDQYRNSAASNAAVFAIAVINELSNLTRSEKTEVLHEIHRVLARSHVMEFAGIAGIIASLLPIIFH